MLHVPEHESCRVTGVDKMSNFAEVGRVLVVTGVDILEVAVDSEMRADAILIGACEALLIKSV